MYTRCILRCHDLSWVLCPVNICPASSTSTRKCDASCRRRSVHKADLFLVTALLWAVYILSRADWILQPLALAMLGMCLTLYLVHFQCQCCASQLQLSYLDPPEVDALHISFTWMQVHSSDHSHCPAHTNTSILAGIWTICTCTSTLTYSSTFLHN